MASATKPTVQKSSPEQQQKIVAILGEVYADTKAALRFDSVFQLLVAVILSAQTNDNQVNRITDSLFALYPDAAALAQVDQEELEGLIRTCGLYKNKAKNILAASRMLVEEFGGEVPDSREELMKLPGVGRKTANVVLSVGFGQPALAVDTHVFRVSRRMGLSDGNTPDQVERDLCQVIPREQWAAAHHWLIWHGRRVCAAQKPKCGSCPVGEFCPSKENT